MTQAQSADAVARSVGTEAPEVRDWGIQLVSFTDWIAGRDLRVSLWVLFGAVDCLLLIACANVANLLLSRALARGGELVLRRALGATHARLICQLLVESVVLSLIGGLAGLAVASSGIRILRATLPHDVLPAVDIRIDSGVLGFAIAASLITGLLFGMAPVWSMARTDLLSILKQVSRSSTGGRRWLGSTLAACELALATVLLIGAGLLSQTVLHLQRQPIGFTPDRLLTFQVSLPVGRYPVDGKAAVYYNSLLASLRAIPGVQATAVSSGLPFGNGNYSTSTMVAINGITDTLSLLTGGL